MLLSQTVEYALRAMVYLAGFSDLPKTTQQVADATRVPAGYLSKVLQALRRADLVAAQRGLHGGFALARPAEAITVLDVINAVDPIQRIETCPLGLPSHGTRLCSLHRRIDDALGLVEAAFADTSLDDLLKDPSTSRPLCDVTVEGSSLAGDARK